MFMEQTLKNYNKVWRKLKFSTEVLIEPNSDNIVKMPVSLFRVSIPCLALAPNIGFH